MKKTKATRLGIAFLLTGIVAVFWYWEGENFSDRAVSGTYTFRLNGGNIDLGS